MTPRRDAGDPSLELWRQHARQGRELDATISALAESASRLIWDDLVNLDEAIGRVTELHHRTEHQVPCTRVHPCAAHQLIITVADGDPNALQAVYRCADCWVKVEQVYHCAHCLTEWPCATQLALYPDGPPDEEADA